MIYVAFLAIPLGNLYHSVVSFTEAMFLVFQGQVAFSSGLYSFVLPVLLGNTFGGVVFVTLVNYFQTTTMRLTEAREYGPENQLSWKEWFFGSLVGRSYIESNEGH
jgi:membrane protein YqaA with SNARE-associated domain